MLNLLNDYDVLFWDFDGVIMNSNSVRDLGFEKVLANYPKDQVAELMKFHNKNGGLSRYVKFKYFFEVIRNEEIDITVFNKLLIDFSRIMLELLKNENLLIEETLLYLKSCVNKRMHIASGSDQDELREICASLNISGYFNSIFGSPTPKNDLVHNLIKENDYNLKKCVLIGDSINDFEASKINGIKFLGFNNSEIELLTNI